MNAGNLRPSIRVPDACPHCGGAPGKAHIEVQTRRSLSGSFLDFLALRVRYQVTTVKVPGVCAACARSLEWRRYAADGLTVLPFLILGGAGILTESKLMMGLFLLYLLYLARELSYNWADVLVYGKPFSESMEPYAVEGVSTMRLPAGGWHCAVRIGILPALFLFLGLLGGMLDALGLIGRSSRHEAASAAVVTPATKATTEMTREEQFAILKDLLQSEAVFAVPLDPATFAALPAALRDQPLNTLKPGSVHPVLKLDSMRMGSSTGKVLIVWSPGSTPPPRTICMDMTGRQLLEAFVKTGCKILGFERPGGRLALGPYDANRLVRELPAVPPAPFRIYRTP